MRYVLFAVLLCSINASHAQPFPRNYLSGNWEKKTVIDNLTNIDAWRQSKNSAIRDQVSRLSSPERQAILQQGDLAAEFDWPEMPVSMYMEYKQTGNRDHYESASAKRRQVLKQIALAALVDSSSKYLPALIKGVNAICEEISWVLPAHTSLQKSGVGMPDTKDPVIDLGAGETSVLMAWVGNLFKNRFDQVSPSIYAHIEALLNERLFQPYLRHDDFMWLGLQQNNAVNNWNIWINSNVLMSAALACNDVGQRDEIIYKTMRSVDKFINSYRDDGACEEGPAYWSDAPGVMIHYLGTLSDLTNGKVEIFNQPLIRKMGSYMLNMCIYGDYFVNFGDAAAHIYPDFLSLFLYGKYCDDPEFLSFSSYQRQMVAGHAVNGTPITRALNAYGYNSAFFEYLGMASTVNSAQPGFKPFPYSWMEGIQVATMRQIKSPNALFVGLQGGSNGLSHCHLSVGNFIVYVRGLPALIDVGVGTYTNITFSAARSTVWNVQSQWHNTPTINGVQQAEGLSFKAMDVSFSAKEGHYRVSMDLAKAYPSEAEVQHWVRNWDFDTTAGTLALEDDYTLSRFKTASILNFITAVNIQKISDGEIRVATKYPGDFLDIKFDPAQLDIQVDQRSTSDDKVIAANWGNALYHVMFVVKSTSLDGKIRLLFSKN
jgi:hypothetical protein